MEKTKKPPDSVEDLKKQLNRTNQIVVDTLSELKLTKEDRDELTEENKNLKERVKLLETGSATGTESLRKDMQKMKMTIEEQRQQLLDKASDIERLKCKLQDAEKRASEAETVFGSDELAKRSKDYAKLFEDRGKELEEKEKQIATLRKIKDVEIKDLQQQLDNVLKELKKSEEYVKQKHGQIVKFEAHGQEMYNKQVELSQENIELQKELNETRGRVNDGMVRVAKLEKDKKEAHQRLKQTEEHFQSNIRTLEGKLKTLSAERDDLRDRSKDYAKSFEDRGKELEEKEKQIATLRKSKDVEIKDLQQQLDNVLKELKRSEEFVKQKHGQIVKFEAHGQEMYNKQVELSQENIELQKELNETRGRVNDGMVRVAKLEKDKKEAHQRLKQTEEHFQSNIRTLEGKLKTLSAERDDLRDRSKDYAKSFEDRGKELEEKEKQIATLRKSKDVEIKDLQQQLDNVLKELKRSEEFVQQKHGQIVKFEAHGQEMYNKQVELSQENIELQKELNETRGRVIDGMVRVAKLEKDKKEAHQRLKQTEEHFQSNIRTLEGKLKTLSAERDDLRDRSKDYAKSFEDRGKELEEKEKQIATLRKSKDVEIKDLQQQFSKMAGKKLTDNNADIADLSDPNRAMKLSEKFGQLYDDEWTDAFTELTDRIKMKPIEAIQFLLWILQESKTFCQKIADGQMASLKNVLLHPADQDPSKFVPASKDRPRVASKDDRSLKELRRQIGNTIGNEIKQHFLMEISKEQKHQKMVGAAKPYVEGCAEICWLMVLHDPVLYMDMKVKTGDKLDANIYSAYSSTGNKIEYLVWPPLYNGENGGLLSKGAAGTQRTVEAKRK